MTKKLLIIGTGRAGPRGAASVGQGVCRQGMVRFRHFHHRWGRDLNVGLSRHKQMFGARSIVFQHYALDLS